MKCLLVALALTSLLGAPAFALEDEGSLVSTLRDLCGQVKGARFAGKATSSSCVCPTGVMTFSSFQSIYASSGTVEASQFVNDCTGDEPLPPLPPPPPPQSGDAETQLIGYCRLIDGARLEGSGDSSVCLCGNTLWTVPNFQHTFLSAGGNPQGFATACELEIYQAHHFEP